jgi:hypothetical protein
MISGKDIRRIVFFAREPLAKVADAVIRHGSGEVLALSGRPVWCLR